MLLSGHQPVYLPSILLFTKIAHSDEFMFTGHCQASPGTWHNRNQIRGAKLTIPVKHDFGQSINETEFAGDHWKKKHLRSIEFAYGKRPFFKDYFPRIAEIILLPALSLGLLNVRLIELFIEILELKTEMLDSVDYPIEGHRTDMLISMCKATGADQYLSNRGAMDYVDEEKMAGAGIKHRWLNFVHPIYDQGHSEFITNLSIIDLLFNCGPDSGRIVREAGSVG
jgi:hypothetical protein